MIVTFILVLFYSSHPNGCDFISPRFLNEIKEGSQTLHLMEAMEMELYIELIVIFFDTWRQSVLF